MAFINCALWRIRKYLVKTKLMPENMPAVSPYRCLIAIPVLEGLIKIHIPANATIIPAILHSVKRSFKKLAPNRRAHMGLVKSNITVTERLLNFRARTNA